MLPIQTWQKYLTPLLAPLSLIYGGVALLRRRLTEHGLLKALHLFPSWLPPVPCVSVGNISWGGTGKTPVTDWILGEAEQRGVRCAVLTRGYGVKVPKTSLPLWVRADMLPAQCGDEPLMLAKRHPLAAVIVDPARNRAAQQALAGVEPPHMFLLDDGFQRVSTGRHVNVVLLDADDVRLTAKGHPSHWNKVLPWGTWREPAAALSAADVFLIKAEKDDWPELERDARVRLAAWPRPLFPFRLKPESLRFCGTGNETRGEATAPYAPNRPYLLLTGVGNPDQVRRTVKDFMGAEPAQHLIFPDHYDFAGQQNTVLEIWQQAVQTCGLSASVPVICTAKDAVKLNYITHLYALDVGAEFYSNQHDEAFDAWFRQRMDTMNLPSFLKSL